MTHIAIDASTLLDAAAKIDTIDGAAINKALRAMVQAEVGAFDTRTRRAMNAGIALSDEYVSSKMVREDDPALPRTTITAFGPGRRDPSGLTILGHYDPTTIWEPAKRARAKGSQARGVPAGSKAAGVRITVRRGAAKYLPGAFMMTLKGTGGKTGVFYRDGSKLRHLYGVSPYSLFRFQLDRTGDDLADRIQAAGAEAIGQLVAL